MGSLRFFIVVEILLFLFGVYQVLTNPALLLLLAFGIFCVYLGLRKRKRGRGNFQSFELIFGLFMIFLGLASSPAFWIMLILAVLYIGLKGIEISGVDITKNSFWRKKQMIIVKSTEPQDHDNQKEKMQWLGSERIGDDVYEWNDINLNLLAGDTIVDLGNTLLPKDDSIVIIRKGFGRTRILVPLGVGIQLQHSALYGQIEFENTQDALKNETVTLYSSDYDQNPRRLKILTNTLVGDLEVIRV
ncbi:cell wall-active antibiotics response protein LiaF [Enterococcus sp. HY326]|uniref:cell wall-active antibiotics response protein LiaF n=1 Tax=Enterococcus sp. HY326 TaxID=2971265 RepID=UPI00223EE6BF|nr:cell wall-active antibiotics response protein LiaF [Enterococcus sp. HY326]